MRDFEQILKSVNKSHKDISKSLNLLESFKSSCDYEKVISESLHLAKISENLTEATRLLPIFTGCPTIKSNIDKIIIDGFNVKIDTKKEFVHIHCNSLLPKKESGRAGYVRASMVTAFDEYQKKYNIKIINEPVVLVFIHNYARKERMWRDHDNIEVNVVVDAIALYFLSDDTSKLCDHLYFSREANEDGTDIYIVKQVDFINWLKEYYKKNEGGI